MLGSLILYLKGMRIMMFQLSGFCYRVFWAWGVRLCGISGDFRVFLGALGSLKPDISSKCCVGLHVRAAWRGFLECRTPIQRYYEGK